LLTIEEEEEAEEEEGLFVREEKHETYNTNRE